MMVKAQVFCYNYLEVVKMNDAILKDIESLTNPEKKELIKKVLNTMNGSDIQEIMEEIQDELEAIGILKLVDQNFDDWNSEEDAVYDTL